MSNEHKLVFPQTIMNACERFLGVQGTPNFMRYNIYEKQKILDVLQLCCSHLEIVHFLGACHYLQGGSFTYPSTLHYQAVHYPELGPGISILGSETWMKSGMGYRELIIVPQAKYSSRESGKTRSYTHDFGLYIPKNITRAMDRFYLIAAVEVDGTKFHQDRRKDDAIRDRNVPYPVIRVKEEDQDALEWFRFADPGHSACIIPIEEYGKMSA